MSEMQNATELQNEVRNFASVKRKKYVTNKHQKICVNIMSTTAQTIRIINAKTTMTTGTSAARTIIITMSMNTTITNTNMKRA